MIDDAHDRSGRHRSRPCAIASTVARGASCASTRRRSASKSRDAGDGHESPRHPTSLAYVLYTSGIHRRAEGRDDRAPRGGRAALRRRLHPVRRGPTRCSTWRRSPSTRRRSRSGARCSTAHGASCAPDERFVARRASPRRCTPSVDTAWLTAAVFNTVVDDGLANPARAAPADHRRRSALGRPRRDERGTGSRTCGSSTGTGRPRRRRSRRATRSGRSRPMPNGSRSGGRSRTPSSTSSTTGGVRSRSASRVSCTSAAPDSPAATSIDRSSRPSGSFPIRSIPTRRAASTAPVTSCATGPTATSSSSAGSTTRSRSGASGWNRARSKPRSVDSQLSPRARSSPAPDARSAHHSSSPIVVASDPDEFSIARSCARELRARLPEHLMPVRHRALDALPLTPNGKVDRRALGRARCARRARGGVRGAGHRDRGGAGRALGFDPRRRARRSR